MSQNQNGSKMKIKGSNTFPNGIKLDWFILPEMNHREENLVLENWIIHAAHTFGADLMLTRWNHVLLPNQTFPLFLVGFHASLLSRCWC